MKRKLLTVMIPGLGGAKGAEIGPIPRITAREYPLQVNEAGGPKGSATAAHTYPGSEAFYVLEGELPQKTTHGVTRVTAGQSIAGHGGDTPMMMSNSVPKTCMSLHCSSSMPVSCSRH